MTHQDAEEFGSAPNEPHDPQGRPVKNPTMANKWYLEYVETRTKLVAVDEDKLSKEQLEIIKDKTLGASDDEFIEIFTTIGETTSNDLEKSEVSDYPFKIKEESDNG